MKALIVPDVHMKFENMIDTIHDLWRQHRPDKLVLLGDYFDDWGKTGDDALYWRTSDMLEYLRENFPTVFLLGNHDTPYLLNEPQRYSSDSAEVRQDIKARLLDANPYVVYEIDGVLLSHAGFIDEPTPELKRRWSELPEATKHYLAHATDGPLWVRPDVLELCGNVSQPQVVGHSPVKQATVFKTPNSSVIVTDTWSTYRDGRPIGDCDMYLLTNGQLQSVKHGLIPWNQKEDANVIER